MQFHATVQEAEEGKWVAECTALDAQGRGLSATAALDRLRDEIRYRLELCPCSGIEEGSIELELST